MKIEIIENFCAKCYDKTKSFSEKISNPYLGRTVRVLSFVPITALHIVCTPLLLIEKVAAAAINLVKINFSKNSSFEKNKLKLDCINESRGILYSLVFPFGAFFELSFGLEKEYNNFEKKYKSQN